MSEIGSGCITAITALFVMVSPALNSGISLHHHRRTISHSLIVEENRAVETVSAGYSNNVLVITFCRRQMLLL